MATQQKAAKKTSASKAPAKKAVAKAPLTRGAPATPADDGDGRGAIAVVREAPER